MGFNSVFKWLTPIIYSPLSEGSISKFYNPFKFSGLNCVNCIVIRPIALYYVEFLNAVPADVSFNWNM